MTNKPIRATIMLCLIALSAAFLAGCAQTSLRGTGDLGVIIERAAGNLVVVETTTNTILSRVPGLGDTSHASVVFSRDERYAYVFGRDGGLTKVDILAGKVVNRVVQGGNSIGGAISQDGRLVAVGNYEPGGVRVFDSETLEQVADIPAIAADGSTSKVIGLVDAPGNRFVFTLYDAGETWIADMADPTAPKLTKFIDIGALPYDALITGNGRYYIAGLFGEDGLSLLDMWNTGAGMRQILDGYGRGEEPLPVYKMPHLEGWAVAGNIAVLPAVGRHEVLLLDMSSWKEVGRIPVYGQPVFAVMRPDGRQIWVNFAHPLNDTVQVIDLPSRKIVATLKPGKAVLHMEFTPRGGHVWVSVRDADKVVVYDTATLQSVKELPVSKPSGIFFTARAHKTGL
jgi:protein NirF